MGDEEGLRLCVVLLFQILAMTILMNVQLQSVQARTPIVSPVQSGVDHWQPHTPAEDALHGNDSGGDLNVLVSSSAPEQVVLSHRAVALTSDDSGGRVLSVQRTAALFDLTTEDGRAELMAAAGIAEADRKHVDFIITKESSWDHLAVNAQTGAYGLFQSIPSHWQETWPENFESDPLAQFKWAAWYMEQSYGSWGAAAEFWRLNNYW